MQLPRHLGRRPVPLLATLVAVSLREDATDLRMQTREVFLGVIEAHSGAEVLVLELLVVVPRSLLLALQAVSLVQPQSPGTPVLMHAAYVAIHFARGQTGLTASLETAM